MQTSKLCFFETLILLRAGPHPPTEVEAMEVAETFFSLTWHSSKWDNVTILYSSSGRQNKSHTKNNDITIQDVVPGSKYEVTIMSVASSVESFPVKLVVFTRKCIRCRCLGFIGAVWSCSTSIHIYLALFRPFST